MLVIRFLRSGRTNQSFFRVVLTQKSNPPKSKFIKVLGWYNPNTKESSLNKEEILDWVTKGAKPSNSVSKLLINNKITHKNIVFTPDAPKQKKEKSGGEKKPKAVEESAEDLQENSTPEEKIESDTDEQRDEQKIEEKAEDKGTKETKGDQSNNEPESRDNKE